MALQLTFFPWNIPFEAIQIQKGRKNHQKFEIEWQMKLIEKFLENGIFSLIWFLCYFFLDYHAMRSFTLSSNETFYFIVISLCLLKSQQTNEIPMSYRPPTTQTHTHTFQHFTISSTTIMEKL